VQAYGKPAYSHPKTTAKSQKHNTYVEIVRSKKNVKPNQLTVIATRLCWCFNYFAGGVFIFGVLFSIFTTIQ